MHGGVSSPCSLAFQCRSVLSHQSQHSPILVITITTAHLPTESETYLGDPAPLYSKGLPPTWVSASEAGIMRSVWKAPATASMEALRAPAPEAASITSLRADRWPLTTRPCKCRRGYRSVAEEGSRIKL